MNRLADTPALDTEIRAIAAALRSGTFLMMNPNDASSGDADFTTAQDRAMKMANRLEALLRTRHPADRLPDSVRDFIQGMEVSVDVSTGEDDAGDRYFGTVTEVMDDTGKHGVILLVQDAKPNFDRTTIHTKPPAPTIDPLGDVFLAISRGEGYEDVHPEILADDFVNGGGSGFDWRVLPVPELGRLPELPEPGLVKKRGPEAGIYFNEHQMRAYGRRVHAQAIEQAGVEAGAAPSA